MYSLAADAAAGALVGDIVGLNEGAQFRAQGLGFTVQASQPESPKLRPLKPKPSNLTLNSQSQTQSTVWRKLRGRGLKGKM